MIVDPGTGFSQYPGPGNNGHAQMIIFTLSRNETVTSGYLLNEVYPATITPVNLGFGMYNDYSRLQIIFNYRDYDYTDSVGSWSSSSSSAAAAAQNAFIDVRVNQIEREMDQMENWKSI